MANETELKLSLPAEAQALMLRQPVLKRAVSRQTQQLVNLYYDTPSLSLYQRGIALRLYREAVIRRREDSPHRAPAPGAWPRRNCRSRTERWCRL